jgi:hypothetical protein
MDLQNTVLVDVLNKAKKTDLVSAKAMLYQAYETTMGIHDYFAQDALEREEPDPNKIRPLSEVAMHFAEDACSTSRLYEMIRVFEDRKVYPYFGLNLKEFLELPHDICENILEICLSRQTKELAIQGNVIDKIENENKKR